MDILSDVNITGALIIDSPYAKSSNGIALMVKQKAEFKHVSVNSLYSSTYITACSACFDKVDMHGCLSFWKPSMTKKISVPAQCTRFLIGQYEMGAMIGDEEDNNKYPVITAYRGNKKVDMDVEIINNRTDDISYTEFIIGNITSCSSDMTLRVSMLA